MFEVNVSQATSHNTHNTVWQEPVDHHQSVKHSTKPEPRSDTLDHVGQAAALCALLPTRVVPVPAVGSRRS